MPENPFDGGKASLDVKFPDLVPEIEEAAPIVSIPRFPSTAPRPAADGSDSDQPTILSYKGTTYPPTEQDASPDQAFTPKLVTPPSSSTSSPAATKVESYEEDSGTSSSKDDSAPSKVEDRDLTEAERRGAWTLLAIVVGGFLAGGIGKEKKVDVKEAVESVKSKGKEAKGKAEGLVEQGKKKAEEIKDKAEGLVDDAKSKGKGLLADGKKKAEGVKEKSKDLVEDGKKKAKEAKGKGEDLVEEGKKKAKEATQ